MISAITNWLETHWVNPAYSGWLLGAIALCFFGAATNTMAGWLYLISGIIFALLVLAAILPLRSLRQLEVARKQIEPVTAGDQLTVEITITNPTDQPKTLLQLQDTIPYVLGQAVKTAIELIPPQSTQKWIYYQLADKRGVYRWQTLQIRTATPLGLFWCRRGRELPAIAIVYPQILILSVCPLIDDLGREESVQFRHRERSAQTATEGITRALRPYRVGDPTRLIHWRTSARYGELKVRELEVFNGGQDIIISLDSSGEWQLADFEQAAIAAASLYFYASRAQLNVKLWTAATGLVQGNRKVLETLAATYAGEIPQSVAPPNLPLIWLTPNPSSIKSLPANSRWVLWSSAAAPKNLNFLGLEIEPEQSLQLQLQRPVSHL
jgi:uncharacterized protein (DUF58 family)